MTQYSLLSQSVSRHIQLSAGDFARFSEAFQLKEIKKKHYLLQEGEINSMIVFVTEGILRSYAIDQNGFEHVLQFAPLGWWMGDMYSFTRQKPSGLFIDALEHSSLLVMPKTTLDQLYTDIPQLEHYFRILAENSVIAYQKRIIGNLSEPAIARYNTFCKDYPSLIECLPQKQIASYIGVTPEFLSKMLHDKPVRN
jgi:CRP-like cAMP-binding protein